MYGETWKCGVVLQQLQLWAQLWFWGGPVDSLDPHLGSSGGCLASSGIFGVKKFGQ